MGVYCLTGDRRKTNHPARTRCKKTCYKNLLQKACNHDTGTLQPDVTTA